MNTILDKSGVIRPKWAVDLVDDFLIKVKSRPMWEMIDFIVSVYLTKHPGYLKIDRSSYNQFASTEDKSMRKLLSMPIDLKDTIDWFYKDEIKNIGEVKFWRMFAKKYPTFSYATKI